MNSTEHNVVELPGDKMVDAAGLLTRVFFDDPLMLYIFPDESDRREAGARFFLPNMQHAAQKGKLYTTASFPGIAVWRFFGLEDESAKKAMDDPRIKLPSTMGPAAFQRLMTFLAIATEFHKKLVPEKHCYLLFLGLEPEWQVKGVGTALITPILRMADDNQLPCYLETNKARNLVFYGKMGFEVREKGLVPDGPEVWGLVRAPRDK